MSKAIALMKGPVAVALVAKLLLIGCGHRGEDQGGAGPLRLGYIAGPHAAAIYVAEDQAARDGNEPVFTGIPFLSSSDIGYALMAGEIDAGFVETSRATALFRAVNGLQAIGAITFPYGASLVLRKDLDLRVNDLAGRTVAVAGRRCRLLHQFLADAARLGVEPDTIDFVPLPFEQMIPALEARRVDAILTRGGHALLAAAQDHLTLYQNWNIVGDDECCPQALAQVELVLVTRGESAESQRIRRLSETLEAVNAVAAETLRAAVSARTRIPLSALEPFPVSSYAALTPEQQEELGSP